MMDKETVEENSEAVVQNAAEFHKSLKELRDFSSQLYHAADYCKTAFLSSKEKTRVLETTKDYASRAVVVVVDHLGSMSAKLESCISKTTSVSKTERKLESLMQRIGMCQNYSYKISLHRFHLGADFSRYHCRYVSPLLKDSTVPNVVSCNTKGSIAAKSEEETPFEGVELDTNNCKPSVVEAEVKKHNDSSRNYQNLLPVEDGLSILPKTKNSAFRFQESERLKRSAINWKAMVQNKEIAALVKRGKRLLA